MVQLVPQPTSPERLAFFLISAEQDQENVLSGPLVFVVHDTKFYKKYCKEMASQNDGRDFRDADGVVIHREKDRVAFMEAVLIAQEEVKGKPVEIRHFYNPNKIYDTPASKAALQERPIFQALKAKWESDSQDKAQPGEPKTFQSVLEQAMAMVNALSEPESADLVLANLADQENSPFLQFSEHEAHTMAEAAHAAGLAWGGYAMPEGARTELRTKLRNGLAPGAEFNELTVVNSVLMHFVGGIYKAVQIENPETTEAEDLRLTIEKLQACIAQLIGKHFGMEIVTGPVRLVNREED